MLIESVRGLRDGFVVMWGRLRELRKRRQDFLVGSSLELGPGLLYDRRFVRERVGKTEFDQLIAGEEPKRGNPASATEEGVGRDFFTTLEADESFFEAQYVTADDPNVLCDEVEEICVVKQTPCSILPEDPSMYLAYTSQLRVCERKDKGMLSRSMRLQFLKAP